MKKVCAWLSMALVLCMFCITGLGETVTVVARRLNLRDFPQGEIVTTIPRGTKLDALGFYTLSSGKLKQVSAGKSKWTMVSYKGKVGFLWNEYLTLGDLPEESGETIDSTDQGFMMKLKSKVTFYSRMSKSSSKMGSLPAGTEVKCVAVSGKWAKFYRDGKYAYALRSQFQVVSKTYNCEATVAPRTRVYAAPAAKNFSQIGRFGSREYKLTVLEVSGDWACIEYQARRGYVLLSTLKKK